MAERAYVAILRHGAYHQRKGVPSARQPWPLTDEGRAQARAGADLLAAMIAERGLRLSPVIHASHQLRAWQTAQEVAVQLGELGHATEAVEETP
ncbi:MAG: histidine phosphatase family protein, partial [Mameliella sp.]|nr:histidine phosphatase family protein [Mameliella sp.]